MEKTIVTFEDFLADVLPEHQHFVKSIHITLLAEGYKCKLEHKASGYFAGYSHPKTKRSLLNFLFRKKGLLTRIYGDHCGAYADFLGTIPESMEKEIRKASVCKRLVNPDDCSPTCVKGYDFMIGDNHYQRCRYSGFQFLVTADSIPVLESFVQHECRERRAG